MSIHNLLKALTSAFARRPLARRSPPTCHPFVEALEDRTVPSLAPLIDYGAAPLGALVAADLNGDGRIDLGPLASGGTPGINALFGNGDGTFHQAQIPGVGTYTTPIVADLNGDTIGDLVKITNYLDLRVQLGNSDGTYQETQVIVLPSQLPPGAGFYASQNPTMMTLGDLNADGKLDLVATGYDQEFIDNYGTSRLDYYVNVLLGDGDGTFGPSSAYYVTSTISSASYSESGTSILPVRDYDGDGKSDVLTTGGAVRLFSGNGDGTLQTSPSNYSGAWTTPDVNADGQLDNVDLFYYPSPGPYGGGDTPRYAYVSLGNGDGSFAPAVVSDLGPGSSARYVIHKDFADFDGDGLPELVTVEFGDNQGSFVCVAHNDGVWTPPTPPPPSVAIGDVTITEGNTGTRAATFTVTLSAVSSQPVTVAYATADGAATAGSDYQGTTGTLTIPAGQTTATITVPVNGDRLPETNESFSVNLSGATNAVIADGQGAGTIMDDEPRISISDVTKREGKKGKTTLFTFTVTLSAAYDQPVTMSFRTVNGTATTGDSDYVFQTGTLTFAPGQTTKTITIVVNGDSKKEANETFYLDLFGNSGNSLFTKNRGLGTILNDD